MTAFYLGAPFIALVLAGLVLLLFVLVFKRH